MQDRRRRRLDSGRVDAEEVVKMSVVKHLTSLCCLQVINELMEDFQIDSVAVEEGSAGLQLYLGPDGSVRFDQPSKLETDFQPVVFDTNR